MYVRDILEPEGPAKNIEMGREKKQFFLVRSKETSSGIFLSTRNESNLGIFLTYTNLIAKSYIFSRKCKALGSLGGLREER